MKLHMLMLQNLKQSLVYNDLDIQKENLAMIVKSELSVGILPYPITFLVTDLISEIYGKKKANQVVIAGIFASLFRLLSSAN